MSKLLPTLTLGISVTAGMFFFTYLPQAAVLAIFNGPLAALSTILLVLSESSTIFMALAKTMLIEDSLVDTFDGVRFTLNSSSIFEEKRPVLMHVYRHSSPRVRPTFFLLNARSSPAATQLHVSASLFQSLSPSSHRKL